MNYDLTYLDALKDLRWDERELIDLTIVQRIMGTISIIGSTYIIQDILRNEQKRKHTFHRLMVGLSIANIISSFSIHLLSTAPMPKGYFVLAVGNVAACDIQGFISWMCAFLNPLYNCSLATYYLVQLKYNWVNRRIKALEKWFHTVPWIVGLVFAIAGLAFKSYGPHGFSCSITKMKYPLECSLPGSSVECLRGSNANAFWTLHLAYIVIIILALCYICIIMYMVYRSAADIEIQAQKYTFARYRSQNNDRKRSRRVMLQGLLYSSALILVYLFPILTILMNALSKVDKISYTIYILTYSFWPLQGFFNALIYAIPIFQRMYKRQKEKKKERWIKLESKEGKVESSKTQINFKLSQHEKKQQVVAVVSSNLSGSNVKQPSSNCSKDQCQSALEHGEVIIEEQEQMVELYDEEIVPQVLQKRNECTILHHEILCHEFQERDNTNDDNDILHDEEAMREGNKIAYNGNNDDVFCDIFHNKEDMRERNGNNIQHIESTVFVNDESGSKSGDDDHAYTDAGTDDDTDDDDNRFDDYLRLSTYP